jgi:hypothetical protein
MMYHSYSPVHVALAEPVFAQRYFYDAKKAADTRLASKQGEDLDRDIVTQLSEYIHTHNQIAKEFRTAREMLLESEGRTMALYDRIVLTPQMRLVVENGADRRRENLPTADEVAVFIPDEYSNPSFRDIVLYERDNQRSLDDISSASPGYWPLAYPLMMPDGRPFFRWGMRLHGRRTNDHITARAFYRYHLFPRARRQCNPFAYGRLFQQLLVDQWAAVDQKELEFYFFNQKKIRADTYKGLDDAINRGDLDPSDIGRRTVLPSQYIGGPRFYNKCYMNSMAIVRKYGRPSLFLTFTANPNWVEVQRELLPGQTANNRPDLVARVFSMKKRELLREITRDHIFGQCIGNVWTIEYQKRGLPHMHMLIFLSAGDRDRLLDPSWIDQFIHAELPTPEQDPDGLLRTAVHLYMLHGPCGADNQNAPCMQEMHSGQPKKCSKRYPRAFTEHTTVGEDGYPIYRRRPGRTFTTKKAGRDFTFDNRYVVPYNAYLLRKYDSHINLEICASVKSVKYIHKYIYKGSDLATAEVSVKAYRPGIPRSVDRFDEVSQRLHGRYIAPPEAAWRLLEYAVHDETPTVQPLALHLPGLQQVYYGDTHESVCEALDKSATTLTAWFDYNKDHEDGRHLLYQDFPGAYRYISKTRTWQPRQREVVIGRMYSAPSNAGERFYLRTLLTVIRGATSFRNLRTVDGTVYPTFKDACVTLGLVQDDREHELCLSEAIRWQTGRQSRHLFATLLLFGTVANAVKLWEKFRDGLCDDLPRRLDRTGEVSIIPADFEAPHYDYGLFLLSRYLGYQNKTLADFGLPPFALPWDRSGGNSLLAEQYAYEREEQALESEEAINQFNPDQARCFQRIVARIDEAPEGAHFFLQGPAGTGKTFLYRAIAAYFRAQGKVVLCVASSGIAAQLLPGGRTAHSCFKIPIQIHSESACNFTKQSQLGKMMREVGLIIWDEVPMQHKHCFEAVDRHLRDIRDCDKLFGGIPVLLGGDFAQILPVVKRGDQARIVLACLRKSALWKGLEVLTLRENMRIRGQDALNKSFLEWIAKIPYDVALQGVIPLHPDITDVASLDDLYTRVYPAELLETANRDQTVFRSRAVLSTVNETVATINNTVLDMLPGPVSECVAADSLENDTGDDQDLLPAPEVLQSVEISSLPPAVLRLKLGAPVILLRNLQPKEGLCNGTRLVVTRIGRSIIEGRILGGSFDGQMRLLPRIDMCSNEDDFAYIIKRRQFPVRLCFAMTINKSQGQSFEVLGVDLRSSAFTHGQLYVAMSRVTDIRQLTICTSEDRRGITQNIVFPEVLLA